MSAESETARQLVDHYPHRTLESVETDLDAEAVLDGYLAHQEMDRYEFIGSNFPYAAALGRVTDSEGDLHITSHYTYPSGENFQQDNIKASLTVESLDEILEENIIHDEDTILDAAGVELESDKKAPTSDGGELRPSTVHCVVFYNRPVVSSTEDIEYEGPVHEQAAMQALNEPSIATALIHSGQRPSGEDFAGAQIDYWTRTIDGVDGGLDYGELDWENPGEL